MRSYKLLFLVCLALVSSKSFSYEWRVDTTVRLVQPTYMPSIVSFQVNDNAGTCSAGAWMRWEAKGNTEAEKIANANSVYSTLMAALMSGKAVVIYGNNTNCSIDFIHMY